MVPTAQHQFEENPEYPPLSSLVPQVPLILSSMSSISLPNLCLTAQTIRTGTVDPDVGGIAVGVSSMFNVFEKSCDFSNVIMYQCRYGHKYSSS